MRERAHRKYLERKVPLKKERERERDKHLVGDGMDFLSHSKRANQISSPPVESVGNSARLSIDVRDDSDMSQCCTKPQRAAVFT